MDINDEKNSEAIPTVTESKEDVEYQHKRDEQPTQPLLEV